MRKITFISTIILTVLAFTGCENFNSPLTDVDGDENAVTIAEEEIFDFKASEATDEDISEVCTGVTKMKGKMGLGGFHTFFGKNFPPCATVSVSGDEYPKEITIDYADGCSGRNGLEKKGLVTIVMSDTILNPGATYTITIVDMLHGEKTVSKTATITNEGQNDAGNWVLSVISTSTTSFEKEGESYVIIRDMSFIREWLTGFVTSEKEDDSFFLSGGGSVTVNDTIKFERDIIDALLIDRSCKHPLSGIVGITKGEESMTIDFGDGECDNIALVSKDGETAEIELNEGKFRKEHQNKKRNMKQKKGWW